MPLTFTTINLNRDADLCIRFRRDSYACSFADGKERFDRENGEDGYGYVEWLRDRISEWPAGCMHAWLDQQIVGQVELRVREKSNIGYVNLFYLAPECRGQGLGVELHDYAVAEFRNRDIEAIELSVSPTNLRACSFYISQGWFDLGPRSEHPEVHTFRIELNSNVQ